MCQAFPSMKATVVSTARITTPPPPPPPPNKSKLLSWKTNPALWYYQPPGVYLVSLTYYLYASFLWQNTLSKLKDYVTNTYNNKIMTDVHSVSWYIYVMVQMRNVPHRQLTVSEHWVCSWWSIWGGYGTLRRWSLARESMSLGMGYGFWGFIAFLHYSSSLSLCLSEFCVWMRSSCFLKPWFPCCDRVYPSGIIIQNNPLFSNFLSVEVFYYSNTKINDIEIDTRMRCCN